MEGRRQHNFDLENRTLDFSKRVIRMCNALPKNNINLPLIDQVVRASSSVSANYREANDALSKKDKLNRMRISRKEAKESHYFIELIIENNQDMKKRILNLFDEANQLKRILSAIIDSLSSTKDSF
ncbi:MAG: four helix bundle protein [Patescibacteria group bacterium]|nr:four helix bundle protein [Patescibacteria group bacterium]